MPIARPCLHAVASTRLFFTDMTPVREGIFA